MFAIGQAFTQIKENCTGLSESLGVDFCNRENITSAELGLIVRDTVWFGSTGEIGFDGSNRVGTNKYDI